MPIYKQNNGLESSTADHNGISYQNGDTYKAAETVFVHFTNGDIDVSTGLPANNATDPSSHHAYLFTVSPSHVAAISVREGIGGMMIIRGGGFVAFGLTTVSCSISIFAPQFRQ